jgi:hypothetical protein
MEDSNNNLEIFFRDKFNQRIEPQDWNIPDNEVWDGIASEIQQDDKRRRVGILPLFLLGASMLLSTLIGIDNYNKGKDILDLKQELKACVNMPDLSTKESSVTDKVTSEQEVTPTQQKINENHPTNGVNQKSFAQNILRGEFIKNNNKPATTLNLSENEVVDIPELDFDKKSGLETYAENLENKITSPIFISALPILSFTALQSQNVAEVVDMPIVTESIIPIKETVSAITLGPIVRYMQWHDKIKGSFNNPLEGLLVKEETSPSLALGLALNKKINNHLVLKTGLMYYQRNQTSKYEINLPYSTVDEINIGSEFENRFSHSLPTGLGDINTNLVLSRSISSPVTNNENVYLDFSLQNHVSALAVPLMLTYHMKEMGNGFFFQGGIMNEFIIHNEIREVNTESHHTFVQDKSINVDYNTSQINKVNTSALIGIGYEKEILKGIGISLSTNYGFALTNTFATPNYQHKIDQLGLQMMVVKKIK